LKKAVIILSGGLDSTVIMGLALSQGMECYAISFDYNQKHIIELEAAKKICEYYGVQQSIIKLDSTAFQCSSLVSAIPVPKDRSIQEMAENKIPNTYVPARNSLFIAYAMGFAEVLKADEIHYGANQIDSPGYPDCRPEYVSAFQKLINVATKQAVEEKAPRLLAPLINLNKVQIIELGKKLNVPIEMTFSCYSPTVDSTPCLHCDACILRNNALLKLAL